MCLPSHANIVCLWLKLCILYFEKNLFITDLHALEQATADALKNLSTAPPAVRLFAQFCMEAPECFQRMNISCSSSGGVPSNAALAANPWVGRFKVILRCEEIEKFGLPSFITSYNSKPVLIRSTGTLLR